MGTARPADRDHAERVVLCGHPTIPLRLRPDLGPGVPPTAELLVEQGVATGSASRSSRLRKLAHAFVGAAGWLLLGSLWIWQIRAGHVPTNWLPVVSVIAGGAVTFATASVGWIKWNRNIHGRRHNRLTPIIAGIQFEVDAVGRTIVASDDGRQANHVVVRIDPVAAEKHYLAA
jgi:hypothetical protein